VSEEETKLQTHETKESTRLERQALLFDPPTESTSLEKVAAF